MYCPICNTKLNGENFCPNCGQAIDYSSIQQTSPPTMPPTQSYTPTYQSIPQEIKQWNWGAFMYNIVWGIGNKAYLSLLCFIPYFNFIWIFVCGAKGNEWAWKANNYGPEDVEKFLAVQSTWNRAGIAQFIIGIVMFVSIILITILFSALIFGTLSALNY